MDPDECLRQVRQLLATIESDDHGEVGTFGFRLADLVESLDGWLSSGGMLPAVWTSRRDGGVRG